MKRIITPGDADFYINRNRHLEIDVGGQVGVAGFFSGVAIKPGFGVTRSFGMEIPVHNLLTDLGLDALGGTSCNFIRMHLGTGTATPLVTDTALTAFGVNVSSAAPAVTEGAVGSPSFYGWRRLSWTSAVGGATGNWTEIGISSQDTNGALRSKALILDNLGAPTTFTVLADEQFQGFYEFRMYAPTGDDVRTVDISGVPYSVTTRAALAGSWVAPLINVGDSGLGQLGTNIHYTGGLGAITASPSGAVVNGQYPAWTRPAAYGSGSYYRDNRLTVTPSLWVRTWQSISNIASAHNHAFQINYNPAIAKTNIETIILNQRISWARR